MVSRKSSTSSGKLRLRDALLNMLSEFVALNKSPEVRLNSKSQQFLAEAVREETEKRRMSQEFNKDPRHVRSVSSNAALLRSGPTEPSAGPPPGFVRHSRRTSLPVAPAALPSGGGRFSLFPRLRRVAQADDRIRAELNNGQHHHRRRTSVISESEESEEAVAAAEAAAARAHPAAGGQCWQRQVHAL